MPNSPNKGTYVQLPEIIPLNTNVATAESSNNNLNELQRMQTSKENLNALPGPYLATPAPKTTYEIPEECANYFLSYSNSDEPITRLNNLIRAPQVEQVDKFIVKPYAPNLNEIIMQPNLKGNILEMVQRANIRPDKTTEDPDGTCLIGTLIQPNEVGIITNSSKRPFLLGPGRYRTHWRPRYNLENIVGMEKIQRNGFIQSESKLLTIIFVKPQEYGLGFDNGKPEILAPGWHIRLDTPYTFLKMVPQTDLVITHGTTTLARVMPGTLTPVTTSKENLILDQGLHVFKNEANIKVFAPWNISGLNSFYQAINTRHLILIQKGEIGLAWDHGQAILLGPGLHAYDDPQFKYIGSKKLSEPVIQHGTLTLLNIPRVSTGKIFAKIILVGNESLKMF